MTMHIQSVPAAVSRQQVVDMLAMLGLGADQIPRRAGVHIGGDAIRVTVFATDPDGNQFLTDDGEVATHELTIRIEDDR